jgi:hypothetical protein
VLELKESVCAKRIRGVNAVKRGDKADWTGACEQSGGLLDITLINWLLYEGAGYFNIRAITVWRIAADPWRLLMGPRLRRHS